MLEMASFLKYVDLYLTSERGRFYVGHSVFTITLRSPTNREISIYDEEPKSSATARETSAESAPTCQLSTKQDRPQHQVRSSGSREDGPVPPPSLHRATKQTSTHERKERVSLK
jgi:hypothetical protein